MKCLFPPLVSVLFWAATAAGVLAQEQPKPVVDLPSVTVVTAEITPMESTVAVSGSLVARQAVQINPKIAGLAVTSLDADVGDQVEPGEVLARLQDDSATAQLAQAKAEYQRAEAGVNQARSQIQSAEATLTQAKTALERTQRLKATGNTAQASLEQAVATEAAASAAAASAHDGLAVAQATLAQSKAAEDLAALNLEFTKIVSPVAGRVADRSAEIGALSGSGTAPMFTIIANDDIELAAEVVETAIPSLSVGNPAVITVSGVGQIAGEVRLVPAAVDPLTRLGTVRITLDRDQRLRTGVFASGLIVLEKKEALTVPVNAILSDGTGDYVQVVKDGAVETRPVTAGLIWKGRREITNGIQPGETIMARAGAFFRTGDKVRGVPAGQDTTKAAAVQGNPSAAPAEPKK